MKKGFLFICLLVISSMIFSMSASAFGPVQRGDFGADVAEVQQMLINIGYLNDNADGEFGPMTQGAVMAFQSDYGLDVDGMVDDQTYDTLVWASGGVPYETGTWYYNEYNGWWYVNPTGKDYEDALIIGCREMSRLMEPVYGWDTTDNFIYLSLQGSIEVNQGVKPVHDEMFNLRIGIPKTPGKKPLVG